MEWGLTMTFKKINQYNNEQKHYKMYKSKKRWVYSGIVIFFTVSGLGLTVFDTNSVHADVVSQSESAVSSVSSNASSSASLAPSSAASSTASSSEVNGTNVSSNAQSTSSESNSSLPNMNKVSSVAASSAVTSSASSNSSATVASNVASNSNLADNTAASATSSVAQVVTSSVKSIVSSVASSNTLIPSEAVSSESNISSDAVGTTVLTNAKTAVLTRMAVMDAADLTPVNASDIVISAVNTDSNGNNKLYNGYAPQGSDFEVLLPTGMNAPVLDPAQDLTFTPSGQFGYNDTTGTDADTYTIALTQAGLDAIAAANPTYDFSQVSVTDIASSTFQVGQLDINPSEIAITFPTITKTYDGKSFLTNGFSAKPTFTAVDPSISSSVIDYLNGLGITIPVSSLYFNNVSYTGDGATTIGKNDTHAGSYIIGLSGSNSARNGLANMLPDVAGGNFNVSQTGEGPGLDAYAQNGYSLNVNVTPAPATITVNNLNTTYNGSVQSTTIVTSGQIGSDKISTTVSGNGQINVGTYPVTVTLNPATAPSYINSDYAVTISNGTITIAPAPATYTLSGDSSKTYDGTVGSPDLSGYTVTLSNNETYSLQSDDLEIVNDSANVGSYKVQLSATGVADLNMVDPNGNYLFTQANGTSTATYEINKANATVTVVGDTVTYDGNAHNLVATVTGAVNGESIGYDLSNNEDTNAGNYVVTASDNGSTVNSNYNITFVPGNLVINKADATYTLSGDNSKTYDGSNGSVNGSGYFVTLSNGEKYNLQAGDVLITNNGSNAGAYKVALTAAGIANLNDIDSNYIYTDGNGSSTATYEINKADATVTVIGNTFGYDGVSHSLAATVSGAVNGETIGYTLTNNGQINAGNYVVTANGDGSVGNNNYNVTYVAGDLVINKAAATITVNPQTITFDGQDHSLIASVTGTVAGESLDYTLSNNSGVNVGVYTVTPVVGETDTNKNYDISVVAGDLTINQADASYELSGDSSKSYNGTDGVVDGSGYTITLSNGEKYTLQNGDVTIVNNGSNAGNYSVILTAAGIANLNNIDTNYKYDESNGSSTATYEINKANATVTVVGNSVTYDGSAHSLNATVTGEVNGETIGYDLNNNVQTNAGNYTVTAIGNGSAVNNNYNIKYVAGELIINKAATAYALSGDNSKTYDGTIGSVNGSGYTVTLSNGEQYVLKPGDITIVNNGSNAGDYNVTMTTAGIANLNGIDSNYNYTESGGNSTASYKKSRSHYFS